jgi:hypothetical protein
MDPDARVHLFADSGTRPSHLRPSEARRPEEFPDGHQNLLMAEWWRASTEQANL